jgi:hypothetical protein
MFGHRNEELCFGLEVVEAILEFGDASGDEFSKIGIGIGMGAEWVAKELCASSNFGVEQVFQGS